MRLFRDVSGIIIRSRRYHKLMSGRFNILLILHTFSINLFPPRNGPHYGGVKHAVGGLVDSDVSLCDRTRGHRPAPLSQGSWGGGVLKRLQLLKADFCQPQIPALDSPPSKVLFWVRKRSHKHRQTALRRQTKRRATSFLPLSPLPKSDNIHNHTPLRTTQHKPALQPWESARALASRWAPKRYAHATRATISLPPLLLLTLSALCHAKGRPSPLHFQLPVLQPREIRRRQTRKEVGRGKPRVQGLRTALL